MKKYMKFTMYDKERKDKRVPGKSLPGQENFRIDAEGMMRCPNGKGFHFRYRRAVKGNQYGQGRRKSTSAMTAAAVHMRSNARKRQEIAQCESMRN